MKNLSYAISAGLAICVGILFYQVQSLKSGEGEAEKQEPTLEDVKKANTEIIAKAKTPDAKIAFINIDSLNEKYLFIADADKNLRGRQQALEAQIQSLTQKFQQEYEAAQQSAQAGIMPPNELEAKKAQLERQQREIEGKQIQMENLQVELQDKNEKMKDDIKKLLTNYYKDKFDYILTYSNAVPTILLANPMFDITNQVVEVLNNEYKAKKQSQKK
jgi:outer membrane protein